jgi:hypothetical protein
LGRLRLFLVSSGILLMVVAIAAPHGAISVAEFCAGAVLICLALWLPISARKKGTALKDLPWIKAAKKGGGSGSGSST